MLDKIETMCKHCDELTNKVANLEAVGTTLTKAPKMKSSIFDMPKKDASTSCNHLRLDSLSTKYRRQSSEGYPTKID